MKIGVPPVRGRRSGGEPPQRGESRTPVLHVLRGNRDPSPGHQHHDLEAFDLICCPKRDQPDPLSLPRAMELVVRMVPDSLNQYIFRRLVGIDPDGSVVEPVRATDIASVMHLNEGTISRIAQPLRQMLAAKARAAMEGALHIDSAVWTLDAPPTEDEFDRVRGLLAQNSWRTVRVEDGATLRDVQIGVVLHEMRYGRDLDYLVGLRADAKKSAI